MWIRVASVLTQISSFTALSTYYYCFKLSNDPKWNNLGAVLYSAAWATCVCGFLALQTSSSVLDKFYAAGLTHLQTALLLSIADIILHFGPLAAIILCAPTKTTLSVPALIACFLPIFLLYSPAVLDIAYSGVPKGLLLVTAPVLALVAFILKYKSPR